jgi:hypothetical protein
MRRGLALVLSFIVLLWVMARHCFFEMVIMVTMGADLQPGCLADRLLIGLSQPQINP